MRDQPEDGMEAVIRGSDISRFRICDPRAFVRFDKSSFQQVAKETLYRAPAKLIYRFISKSLAFAYDDQRRLTLNSANILIPRLPGLGIKVVLAFLNSSVFQYIFAKRYSTHKVLRGDLESLPFPMLPVHSHNRIAMLVDRIIAGDERNDELQQLIFSSFRLSADEILQTKLGAGS